MRPLLFALVLSLAACADPAPQTAGAPDPASEPLSGPAPGAVAPDFTLVDASGTEHTLSDYRGGIVVLEWLNYDCPYVQKHYGSGTMQALQQEARADGVTWLAIVSSAPGEQGHLSPEAMSARTAEEGGQATAVLLDPSGEVGRSYDAQTTPHMFVIDAEGEVVYNGAIDDRPVTNPASLEGAASYVVPAIVAAREGVPADPATTPPYGCSVKYAG